MSIYTEDEAKTKWCPQVVADDVPADDDGGRRPRCIASQCMAWRLARVKFDDHIEPDISVDAHGNLANIDGVRIGYCGLAGKP